MFGFKIGDTVVHWTYGVGKVVAIDDKGSLGQPLFYYVDEWVLSLGTPREDARTEMEWALREAPARQYAF